MLHDNVTANYQKADADNAMQITLDFKNIANTFKLDNRIKSLTEKEAFITLKDHKPNFYNKQNCCLINLTKSEIGIMSKKFLDQINFF